MALEPSKWYTALNQPIPEIKPEILKNDNVQPQQIQQEVQNVVHQEKSVVEEIKTEKIVETKKNIEKKESLRKENNMSHNDDKTVVKTLQIPTVNSNDANSQLPSPNFGVLVQETNSKDIPIKNNNLVTPFNDNKEQEKNLNKNDLNNSSTIKNSQNNNKVVSENKVEELNTSKNSNINKIPPQKTQSKELDISKTFNANSPQKINNTEKRKKHKSF